MSHDSFCAYDEAGNRYTVHVRRTYIEVRGSDGRGMRVEGLRSYHLGDGDTVDRIDDDSFLVASSGVSLKVRRVGFAA